MQDQGPALNGFKGGKTGSALTSSAFASAVRHRAMRANFASHTRISVSRKLRTEKHPQMQHHTPHDQDLRSTYAIQTTMAAF